MRHSGDVSCTLKGVSSVTYLITLYVKVAPVYNYYMSEQSEQNQTTNLSERLPKRALTRRELLQRGATAGLLTLAALVERGSYPDWLWLKIAEKQFAYPWKEGEEKALYGKEQLFVDANPRLEHGLGKHQYAYALTHPGYSEYMLASFLKDMEGSREKLRDPLFREDFPTIRSMVSKAYGDYRDYVRNLSGLIANLQKSGAPTIFALEERDFYHPDIPREELRPFDSSMIIVTENATSSFVEKVQTPEGVESQKPELLFSTLKEAGVKEVRLAGEWSVAYGGLGCLGGVAQQLFEKGFNVRGVEGCMYPAIRPKTIDSEVLKRLYIDPVSLSSIASV